MKKYYFFINLFKLNFSLKKKGYKAAFNSFLVNTISAHVVEK